MTIGGVPPQLRNHGLVSSGVDIIKIVLHHIDESSIAAAFLQFIKLKSPRWTMSETREPPSVADVFECCSVDGSVSQNFHVFSYHFSMASLPSFAFLDLVKGKIMQKP